MIHATLAPKKKNILSIQSNDNLPIFQGGGKKEKKKTTTMTVYKTGPNLCKEGGAEL
jgi:hypothetical protein